jgi:hypothetical protein
MVQSAAGFIDGSRAMSRLPEMDRWIVEALRKHASGLRGKTVSVWGSMSPWYEALAVASGASRVTTVEYNRLTYDHELMEQVTPRELPAHTPVGGFGVALSISSFDHDGLGRCVRASRFRWSAAVAIISTHAHGCLGCRVECMQDVCVSVAEWLALHGLRVVAVGVCTGSRHG